jgi:hypothetical protein
MVVADWCNERHHMFCAGEHAGGSRSATARNIRSVQLVIQELRVQAAS